MTARSSLEANWLLWAAAAAVLLGLLALPGGIALNLIGYALASVLAFTLVAMFRRRSIERSLTAGIAVPRWMNRLAFGVIATGFAVSVAQAWFIASHFS